MGEDIAASGGRESGIDPLEPLLAAARPLAVAVVGLLALATVATVFGSGSVLTIGDESICVGVAAGREVPTVDTDAATFASWGLGPGVSATEDQYRLCQSRPGLGTQLLSLLTVLPELLLLLGFLAGVFLLVRRARRSGLFSRPVARVVHRLGWFVLAGAAVAWVGEALASAELVRRMLPAHAFPDVTAYLPVSIPTLLAGAGILSIARMLRLSVAMQEDLDATI